MINLICHFVNEQKHQLLFSFQISQKLNDYLHGDNIKQFLNLNLNLNLKGELEEERWIKINIKDTLDKTLSTWGTCAPTKAKDGKIWMKKFGKEIEKEKGHKIIVDFNFVMDAKIDKRGSRKDSDTT